MTDLKPSGRLKGTFRGFLSRYKILALVIFILAVVTAVRLVTKEGQAAHFDKPGDMEIVYVELGSATFGSMRELGRYYGSLSAPNRFFLSSKAAGEIKALLVDIGDRLVSGQIVAVIDDREYVLARDRALMNERLAEAQVAEAKANLELADSEMRRHTNLNKKSIVTQSEFETIENKLKQATARL
ncbi:MAG: hypothetical protein LBV23_09385 [Deltaproteobacteria bacterium]|nr:hypothetical protein [Deltaproteobacteria bacterium]